MLMVQAAVFECNFLDVFSPFNDCGVTPEVGVSWCDVADALVVSMIVVMIHEVADLQFKIARQVIVFEENLVLEGLMPPLDFTLCLRVVRCPSNMTHAVILEPVSEAAGDIRRTVVAEQPGFVNYLGAVTA